MGGIRRAFLLASGERYASIVLNFVLIAAVSRILSPTEIGVSVIGATIIALTESVRDSPSSYLVQKQEVTKDDARTAFTIMLAISLVIGIAIVALSGWLTRVLRQEGLERFLWVMAASLLPGCVERPITALLRRDMQFGAYAFINITSNLTIAIVTVALALLGSGYLCFAWGFLAGYSVGAVLALCVRPHLWIFRPRLSAARQVLPFNAYGAVGGLLSAAYDMVPYAILGRSVQFDAVGYFNRSITLCRLPDKLNTGAISLALPAFASVARDGGNLAQAYLRSIELLTVVEWPLRVMLVIFAYPAVHIVLGPQWDAIVPLVQIMSLAFLMSTPQMLTYPVLIATGGIRDMLSTSLICWPLAALIIGLGALHGLHMMAWAMFLVTGLQTSVALVFIRRRVHFAWLDLASTIKSSATVTLGSALGPVLVVALSGFRLNVAPLLLLVTAALGGLGWMVAVRLTGHPILAELQHFSIALRRRIRA